MGIAAGLAVAGVAGLGGALISSSASKSAAKTQATAAEKAAEAQTEMFGQVKSLEQPYMDVGSGALDTYKGLLGTGGQGQAGIQATLENTPGYQFTKTQGLQSVASASSASGLIGSGSWTKAAEQYATGLANNTYEQRLNDYLSAVNVGAGAAGNIASAGMASTAASNALLTSGAAATAAGTVGSANAISGGLSGLGNSALLYGLVSSGMYGKQGAQT